jgi:hypothetical protein
MEENHPGSPSKAKQLDHSGFKSQSHEAHMNEVEVELRGNMEAEIRKEGEQKGQNTIDNPARKLSRMDDDSMVRGKRKARAEMEAKLDRLIEIETDMDPKHWEEVHKSELISCFRRSSGDSPVVLVKALAQFPGVRPDQACRLIHDLEIRKEWDNVLCNMRIFDKVSDTVDYMYSMYKAPFPISNRDFCQIRTVEKNYRGNNFIIHFEGVEHSDCPPIRGIVRAHTIISGYVIKESKLYPGGTDMTIVAQTDIKVFSSLIYRVWFPNG